MQRRGGTITSGSVVTMTTVKITRNSATRSEDEGVTWLRFCVAVLTFLWFPDFAITQPSTGQSVSAFPHYVEENNKYQVKDKSRRR
jgi:hypothetical protein